MLSPRFIPESAVGRPQLVRAPRFCLSPCFTPSPESGSVMLSPCFMAQSLFYTAVRSPFLILTGTLTGMNNYRVCMGACCGKLKRIDKVQKGEKVFLVFYG